jgi:integrase
MRNGLISQQLPWKFDELNIPFEEAKEPFRSFDEIQRMIKRGGPSDLEKRDLWKCLYLNGQELEAVLEVVANRDTEPFVYPMFAFVALTGARRGEMLRSRLEDFNLETEKLTLRGTKGRKKKKFVFREVDIHSRLKEVLVQWFDAHPGGQLTFCHADGRPLSEDSANHCFRSALKGTKWEVIRGFHVFRHSFASILASTGVDQRRIDHYLGHVTDEMRKRYQHLFPKDGNKPIDLLLP